jgi:hypothetical protein
MGICASTRCCCATVGRFRPAIGSHRRRRCATRAAGDQLRKCHQLAKQGSRPCRVGVISSVVAKAWKCRVGLHRFWQRHDSPDPNHQVCVRCRKQRIGGAMGGLLARFGPEASRWRMAYRTTGPAGALPDAVAPAHSDCRPEDWTAHGLRTASSRCCPMKVQRSNRPRACRVQRRLADRAGLSEEDPPGRRGLAEVRSTGAVRGCACAASSASNSSRAPMRAPATWTSSRSPSAST